MRYPEGTVLVIIQASALPHVLRLLLVAATAQTSGLHPGLGFRVQGLGFIG